MKTHKITINGTDYNVKYTLRALFIFEQITNKSFEIKTLLDNFIFFYSLILASNQENPIGWEEFIDALDSDPKLQAQLRQIVEESQNFESMFDHEEPDGSKKN